MASTRLIATATQLVADGFVSVPINTGLGQGNVGFSLQSILAEWPFFTAANLSNMEWCLSRVNKASMPTVVDNDILVKQKRHLLYGGSGAFMYDLVQEYVPDSDIIIIESVIYLLFDTNLSAVVNTVNLAIDVDTVKVSDSERITILQNSLN